MSGHSQFKNIMYRKGAQDAKRAKIFSKISREITVAVKEGGADPESNTRLRSALLSARAENMPKDNIERAIKKASGSSDDANYQSVRYEGYGPGGVAIIVEGLTDNKNRTAPAVRSAFTKFGGSLGETNSVSFQFKHTGLIVYPRNVAPIEKFFEAILVAGADDLFGYETTYEVTCAIEDLNNIRERLTEKYGDPLEAQVTWLPINTVEIDANTARSLFKLIDVLEDDDDVQRVIANYKLPPDFSLD